MTETLDIARCRETEERWARLQGLLSAMNQVKRLIMQGEGIQAIFEDTCEILRRQEICSVTWIGLLDEKSQTMRLVAPAGGLPGRFQDEFSVRDARGPYHCARMALRKGRPYLVAAVRESKPCADCLVRSRVPHESALAAPMLFQGRSYGVLVAYADDRWAWGEEATHLLSDLAVDLALGMHTREAEESLRVRSEQLRQLAQRVVSAQEEERQRVSRELHDEAGQALVALKIGLEEVLDDIPTESRAPLRQAIALADTTMERIRRLAHDLRPPALDTAGLNATLAGLCRDFGRRAHLSIEYRGTEISGLGGTANVCFYRVLQEALTNVARHAEARHAVVTLTYDADGIILSVEDDGQGFAMEPYGHPSPGREGVGLLGMRERLSLLGGKLNIHSRSGEGTRLVAHLPWERTP
jgi:signal transduction histidine kinase